MLTERLEIFVITYDRAAALEHTLSCLADSPFAGCRLIVLDNHSRDATPEVCARMAKRFDDMRMVRHPRNVGASGNYLRAVEMASTPYAWVLCDDDELDFSDCDDVIAAIEQDAVDLISVGAPGREDWTPGTTSCRALMARGGRVFYVFSFTPNTIYRTELFDEPSLSEAYRTIDTLYPHLAFVRRQIERDASLHVSRNQIVRRGGITVPSSHLFWFVRWVRCCVAFRERELRRVTIYETQPRRSWWLIDLASGVAQEKLYFPERVWPEVGELVLRLRGRQRLAALAAATLALVPRRVHAAGKALVKRLQRAENQAGPLSVFQGEERF